MRKYFTRVTIYESKCGQRENLATVVVEFRAKGGPNGARRKMQALLRQGIPERLPKKYRGPGFALDSNSLYKSFSSVPDSELPELEIMEIW